MTGLLSNSDPLALVRIRLRHVCEKYRTAKAQREALEVEIKELRAGIVSGGNDEEWRALLEETLSMWGTSFNLK
jgi:hypothetical protein